MISLYPHIAIEGGDGSGKATNAKLLADYLRSIDRDVMEITFPRYGEPSARYVERYLNNVYGPAQEVPADLAALTYAIDRCDRKAQRKMRRHLRNPNGTLISDRSPVSNMAHQGTKIKDKSMRHKFYAEIIELEYGILEEPKPDINFVLLTEPDVAQANVDNKAARTYTTAKRDGHEANFDHMRLALRNYQEICELFPNEFVAIWTMDRTTRLMRPLDDIQAEMRAVLMA